MKSKSLPLDINTEITEWESNKTYKYLGINEVNGINHTINKEKKREKKRKFNKRIRVILRTELNAKNKFIVINILTIPIVTNGFNEINWILTEIKMITPKEIDIKDKIIESVWFDFFL